MMYLHVNPKIYINATVEGRHVKSHTIFGDDDPENDISVDFDSLEVHEDSRLMRMLLVMNPGWL